MSLMKGLDQFRMSLGGWWVVLEKGQVDGVVGFVGGSFWKGKALCPLGILFSIVFSSASRRKYAEKLAF